MDISASVGGSGVPFLDMAANQGLMGEKIAEGLKPLFSRYGLKLDAFVVENVSLPDELQKAIDTRISMGMMGDMGKFTQYQMANSIPLAAQNEVKAEVARVPPSPTRQPFGVRHYGRDYIVWQRNVSRTVAIVPSV